MKTNTITNHTHHLPTRVMIFTDYGQNSKLLGGRKKPQMIKETTKPNINWFNEKVCRPITVMLLRFAAIFQRSP